MTYRPNYVDPKTQKMDAALDGSKPFWPEGVRGIGWDNIGKLGIDGQDRLYWDGKRGERLFALAVGFFTILGSIGAVAQGWAAVCQLGYLGCGKH